jgi:D-tagatose-1,6-bisphosphate aldolase subunit GatZ/KbaZ
MKPLTEFIERHRTGEGGGLTSLCSAHPLVLQACMVYARRRGVPTVLVEATCNQVNQDGGYTGMTAPGFAAFVHDIADRAGVPRASVVLGGDHLGPHPWQQLPAEAAMTRAEMLVESYVAAGFRKIHLDCSMSCAGDPTPLGDLPVAARSARLCAVAERTWRRCGGEPPVYVIGTEVPVPGGPTHVLDHVAVTTPAAARATIEAHREAWAAVGLADAWHRVIAAVVQPGVEFDHHGVVDYAPAQAVALSAVAIEQPRFVFEAHSTDYQTPAALADLVRDHFAILKVGPAATFALREALWALDAIERAMAPWDKPANLREVVLGCMRQDPRHWQRYYPADEPARGFHLEYSLSDRIRYYWSRDDIAAAQARLFANLRQRPMPLALLSQHFPAEVARVRAGDLPAEPEALVVAHLGRVLDDYWQACQPRRMKTHA